MAPIHFLFDIGLINMFLDVAIDTFFSMIGGADTLYTLLGVATTIAIFAALMRPFMGDI